ncbi:MAG: glutathione S-transferase family protein [Bosea sp.]|uniref:glutathione S-transferase family protein n=1 Tax=Bosea sp. (in: a-proteobacteria) TaxID=1871050 RepID=UPI002385DEF1|nr:glutathione S-transferase family protein [Bosea sp. (in: a-proteobacteria)]MCP4737285.1 glutathione S-transferase family protein [Bosea sp. (in: a-proteobacteria)]
MSLTLYFHPLSCYCQKVLVALYENGTPFTPKLVNLGDPGERAEFLALWPIGKFPLLADGARLVPESSVIIEYLALHHAGPQVLLPENPVAALDIRRLDRFFDLYVTTPMQKIVLDRIRPADGKDPLGVEEAREMLRRAYGVLEAELDGRTWAAGESFTMADCSAAPALFYAERCVSFRDGYPRLAAYFERLRTRPSFARALAEAEPFFQFFPRNPSDAELSR